MYFGNAKDGLQTFFRWVLYLFIAWFPFMFYEGYLFNGTATRAVNLAIFVEVGAVIFGLALMGRRRLSFARSPVTLALALLLVCMAVSSFLGVDFATSFWSKATRTTGLFYFIHLALFYLFFWMAFSETKRLRSFIAVFLVSAGLFSIAAFLGGEGAKVIWANRPMPGITIGNSTFAGMYLYLAFMLCVYYFASQPLQQQRWWKNLLPAVFIINPYLINFEVWRGDVDILRNPTGIIGSAQASSLTLFFSIIVLLAFWLVSKLKSARTRRAMLYVGMGIAAIFLAFGAKSLLTEGGIVQRAYLQQSTATRPIVWNFSKHAVADRPLLGWGVDNFEQAFQQYYDNRILEQKNGGEPFLDRAHNIFVDQAVETGYVGTLFYVLAFITILGCLAYVIVRSTDRHDQVFSSVLLVYFFGHLLELQTAFDTTVTYPMLAGMAAAAGILFARTRESKTILLAGWLQKGTGVLLIGAAIALFVAGTVPFAGAQSANAAIRRARSSEKRLPLYEPLFNTPIDEASFLWRTATDLQKAVSLDPDIMDDPKQREGIQQEYLTLVEAYEQHAAERPHDYRIQIDLAQSYIYLRLFGIDRLDEAHEVLDRAVPLMPQAPQAHWLHAVAYVYQRKFDEAKASAKRAYDLNPDIEESTRLALWLEKSIQKFPVIDLYSFRQI